MTKKAWTIKRSSSCEGAVPTPRRTRDLCLYW